MKRRALLVIVAIGFFLIADSPGKGEAPAAKEEREYAKVEMKGQLSESGKVPSLEIMGTVFRLDSRSGPKDFQGGGWRTMVGKTVIVTGRLRFLPLESGREVEVESIRVVEK